MAARLLKLGLAASLVLAWGGTADSADASIFGKPAAEQAAPVENTPEIQAASQRVDQTKSKLDQARRQLDAAKASLKAADAEYRAARADMEALSLRRQADQLADASRPAGDAAQSGTANPNGGGRLVPSNPSDRIDPNGIVKNSAPTPASPADTGDYTTMTDQQAPPAVQ